MPHSKHRKPANSHLNIRYGAISFCLIMCWLLCSGFHCNSNVKALVKTTDISINPSSVFIENDSLSFECKVETAPIRGQKNHDYKVVIFLESDKTQQILDTLSFSNLSLDKLKAVQERVIVHKPLDIDLFQGNGKITIGFLETNTRTQAYKFSEPIQVAQIFRDSSAYLMYHLARLPME